MASSTEGTDRDPARIPFEGGQPYGMASDLVVPGILKLDHLDERRWAEGVTLRPLVFGVSAGYFVNLLRVRVSGILSRHRHSGPGHAFTCGAMALPRA